MERGVLARALYTNTPEAKTELYFRKGDVVTVIEFDYENQLGWWLCSLRGQRGICPGNYFELLEDKYSIPHSPVSTHANNNTRGGIATTAATANPTTTRDPNGIIVSRRNSDSGGGGGGLIVGMVEDPLETYDVPRGSSTSYNSHHDQNHGHDHHHQPSSPSPPLSKVVSGSSNSMMNPLEFYDVPRSHIHPLYTTNSSSSQANHTITTTDSSLQALARAKNRQSEISLLSTGSSAHLSSSASSSASSSSASSSARSSANCDLTSIHQHHHHHNPQPQQQQHQQPQQQAQHENDSFFQVTSRESGSRITEDHNATISNNKSQQQQQNNYPQSNRSSIQSETMVTMAAAAPLQELYDVPRSAPTSRAQSAMSMSSGIGLSIANSDSKDSLDYDVPRSSGNVNGNGSGVVSGGPSVNSVHAYVNHIETKYDNPSVSNSCRSSCCSMNGYGKTRSLSITCDETDGVAVATGHQSLPPTGGAMSSSSSLPDNNNSNRVKLSYEIGNGRGSTVSASAVSNAASVAPDDFYDVPRRSCPPVVARHHHPPSSSMNSSLASMSISKESLHSNNSHNSSRRFNNNSGSSLDIRRRGIIQKGLSADTLSFPHQMSQQQRQQQHKFSSNQHLSQNRNNSSDDTLSFSSAVGVVEDGYLNNDEEEEELQRISSSLSINSHNSFGGKTMTPRSSFCSVRSSGGGRNSFDSNFGGQQQQQQERTGMTEDVKFLPLNPRAAVTVCEKLRQEVVTSVNTILGFVRPKWRTRDNLTEIMPDLRFACIRFNLAIKDMTDFCSRCLSNAKKFTIEVLVTKLQRLLSPLINGSQIIQRDVDELEAYFWSIERLSVSPNNGKNLHQTDCLDQLVLCAKSLQHDVTEIANFLALNSSALFREPERLNPPAPPQLVNPVMTTSESGNNGEGGPTEDYDYVSLMPMEHQAEVEDEIGACSILPPPTTATGPYLVPSDQQLLEFYSSQIAATAPLLSQSISTFISSIQRNDPPKTFNGHLKYVILLAYKMLFVGDTVHRNILNVEIKEEVETKANELHKSVVSLHEASRIASRDFPRILPMQNIVDRVWETTASATQLKKVMMNAACF